jgi:hypothetical protein
MATLRSVAVAGLASLLMWGCARHGSSVPQGGVTASMPDGATPGAAGLSPDAVRVVSRGLVHAQGQREARLQLTFTLANDTLREWTFDTRQQHLAISGHPESAPLFASTTPATPYIVRVPPRSARAVDLFFALPADVHRQGDALPPFDVVWIVDAGGDIVAGRVPFGR